MPDFASIAMRDGVHIVGPTIDRKIVSVQICPPEQEQSFASGLERLDANRLLSNPTGQLIQTSHRSVALLDLPLPPQTSRLGRASSPSHT